MSLEVTSKSSELLAVMNRGWQGVPNSWLGRNVEGSWTEIQVVTW